MTVVRTVRELRDALGAAVGKSTQHAAPSTRAPIVGFVPTMGALHAGHAALFDAARREAATVVASLFVNPRQFNDRRDLEAYPRDEAGDAAMARDHGVDLLFVPGETEIYPDGDSTVVSVGGVAEGFEGAARPGHFQGVATVCLKLFQIVRPDVTYFGQKDAQQVAVIRQLVRDLHLSLDVRVVPTVRDRDGVAWSSRNARLSPDERRRAAALPQALRAAVDAHRAGRDPVAAARAARDGLEVEYASIATFQGEPTLVLAVRLGRTRLIDNVPLSDPARAGLGPS
jgi:pantoate--beta-alanine ligase